MTQLTRQILAFDLLSSIAASLQLQNSCLSDSNQTLPSSLQRSIHTLLWAAHHCDVPELVIVSEQLGRRFGNELRESAQSNAWSFVHTDVILGLGAEPVSFLQVDTLLQVPAYINIPTLYLSIPM